MNLMRVRYRLFGTELKVLIQMFFVRMDLIRLWLIYMYALAEMESYIEDVVKKERGATRCERK